MRWPPVESQRLDPAFRHETDPQERDRIPIVRRASRDRPHQSIAAERAVTPRTVQRWLNAYLERGLDGLRPRKAPGKPGNLPAELADEVQRWVIDGPAEQGLARAHGTHEELADPRLKAQGIRTSRPAVGRSCRKLGIRWYRPSYHDQRGDPDQQAQAQQDIAALKKKRRRARACCGARTRRASRWCRR